MSDKPMTPGNRCFSYLNSLNTSLLLIHWGPLEHSGTEHKQNKYCFLSSWPLNIVDVDVSLVVKQPGLRLTQGWRKQKCLSLSNRSMPGSWWWQTQLMLFSSMTFNIVAVFLFRSVGNHKQSWHWFKETKIDVFFLQLSEEGRQDKLSGFQKCNFLPSWRSLPTESMHILDVLCYNRIHLNLHRPKGFLPFVLHLTSLVQMSLFSTRLA